MGMGSWCLCFCRWHSCAEVVSQSALGYGCSLRCGDRLSVRPGGLLVAALGAARFRLGRFFPDHGLPQLQSPYGFRPAFPLKILLIYLPVTRDLILHPSSRTRSVISPGSHPPVMPGLTGHLKPRNGFSIQNRHLVSLKLPKKPILPPRNDPTITNRHFVLYTGHLIICRAFPSARSEHLRRRGRLPQITLPAASGLHAPDRF